MAEYAEDLKQNYRELHESTGESYESIATRVEAHRDPQLAAWLRSQAAGESAPEDPAGQAPQGRQAPGNGSLKADAGAGQTPPADVAAAAAAEAKAKAEAEAAAADKGK